LPEQIQVGTKIVEMLHLYALANTQVAAYIKPCKLGLAEFIRLFDREKEKILRYVPTLTEYTRRLSVRTDTALSIFTTWDLSYHQVKVATGEDSTECKPLNLFAFLHSSDMKGSYFNSLVLSGLDERLKSSEYDEQTQPRAKGMLDCLGQFAEISEIEEKCESKFADIISTLDEMSVIQVSHSSSDDEYIVTLQPLIQGWIKYELAQERIER
jgi:hypothetical protein